MFVVSYSLQGFFKSLCSEFKPDDLRFPIMSSRGVCGISFNSIMISERLGLFDAVFEIFDGIGYKRTAGNISPWKLVRLPGVY